MIMVIGGRCQGKSSFAKEHFENRVQEKGKTQWEQEKRKNAGRSQKDPKADHWADGETSTWEEFLTSTWCRNFHLLVRRILKKDETLGLPDEQETALFETTSAGLHNWKNMAETIYNANLTALVTDELVTVLSQLIPLNGNTGKKQAASAVCWQKSQRKSGGSAVGLERG